MGVQSVLLLLLIFGSVPFLVHILNGYNYYYDYISSLFAEAPQDYFDFIIVGSGSAGAVIANRLSKNNKVLLLEAGGDPIWLHKIPALAGSLIHRGAHDWNYKIKPQKYAYKAAPGNVGTWPRGKALGGTSNLNYMLYVRCHPKDYDNWANITGDPTWRYENVLPFFKKSLDYHGDYASNREHYGENAYGNLHVEKRQWKPLHEEFKSGMKELGYDSLDLNGPQRSGFATLEVSQKNGYRWGTFAAFIQPALSRKNLQVSRYSQAVKIKFDKNHNAVGVWYIRHGKKFFAKASKEIIVSAGAIDSPKLLMLSGVGPKEHLKTIGIKPKIDLPVGKNLVDHMVVLTPNFIIDQPLSYNPEEDFGINTVAEYISNGTGFLTSPAMVIEQAFMSTSGVRKTGVDWPDMQLYFSAMSTYSTAHQDYSWIFQLDSRYLKSILDPIQGLFSFASWQVLVRPKSIGELTLRDRNPLSPPEIDPHYLEHPDDVKVLQEGIQLAIDLAEKTSVFKKLNARLSPNPLMGCDHHEFRSPEYWECYIRHMGATLYHPVGTCRMGKNVGDPQAVLDSRLRVLRTKGLRVADASIMPVIVNGNTNAPSIMIGEKAADFIREYWSEQYEVCPAIMQYVVVPHNKCFYSRLV